MRTSGLSRRSDLLTAPGAHAQASLEPSTQGPGRPKRERAGLPDLRPWLARRRPLPSPAAPRMTTSSDGGLDVNSFERPSRVASANPLTRVEHAPVVDDEDLRNRPGNPKRRAGTTGAFEDKPR